MGEDDAMLTHTYVALAALAAIAVGCARAVPSSTPRAGATATLLDASGRQVGTVVATPASGGGVSFTIKVTGLSPGAHGVHVHAVGACDGSTATAFSSAGGHYNPTTKQHGRQNPNGWHGGDLANIVVDSATGTGSLTAVAESLTIDSGAAAILDADGSAIIVHANRDDERTDTGPQGPGNSGARIACGVLRAPSS